MRPSSASPDLKRFRDSCAICRATLFSDQTAISVNLLDREKALDKRLVLN